MSTCSDNDQCSYKPCKIVSVSTHYCSSQKNMNFFNISSMNSYILAKWVVTVSLQWRHSGRHGVSHHRRDDCLLNRLSRCRPKKTSKFLLTGLCAWNSPVTGEFPHKRPVTWTMFPFDDVIIWDSLPKEREMPIRHVMKRGMVSIFQIIATGLEIWGQWILLAVTNSNIQDKIC